MQSVAENNQDIDSIVQILRSWFDPEITDIIRVQGQINPRDYIDCAGNILHLLEARWLTDFEETLEAVQVLPPGTPY